MKNVDILREKLVFVAKNFVGEKEIKNNQGFQTLWVDAVMRKAGFQNGWAWCMIAVEAIYKTALTLLFRETGRQIKPLYDEVVKKINPSTQRTYDNFAKSESAYFTVLTQRQATYEDLQVGDIVIFRQANRPLFGHAGIIIETHKDHFITVEGNTNDSGSAEGNEFCIKERTIEADGSGLDVRGFIQLRDF